MRSYTEVVIKGGLDLDEKLMRQDTLNAVEKLLQKGDIRAIVIECSNLGSYSYDIYEQFGIPVFDAITGAKMINYCVCPPKYNF